MWRIPIHRSLAVVLFTILYLSMGLYLGRKPGHQLEALILRYAKHIQYLVLCEKAPGVGQIACDHIKDVCEMMGTAIAGR